MAPFEPQDCPLQPQDGPLEPQEGPLEPQESPFEPQESPLEAQDCPLKPQNGPFEPEEAPLEPQDDPLEPQDCPVGPKNGSFEPEESPLDPQEGPLERQDCPLEPQDCHLEPQEGPVEAKDYPLDPEDGPLEPQDCRLEPQEGAEIGGSGHPISPEPRPRAFSLRRCIFGTEGTHHGYNGLAQRARYRRPDFSPPRFSSKTSTVALAACVVHNVNYAQISRPRTALLGWFYPGPKKFKIGMALKLQKGAAGGSNPRALVSPGRPTHTKKMEVRRRRVEPY